MIIFTIRTIAPPRLEVTRGQAARLVAFIWHFCQPWRSGVAGCW